jgi:hypothetical protein
MDATLEAVLIQLAFFIVSIIGAWIVLGLLKGTAQVKQKGAQFGGAAAMFVAMFFLLNRYVPQIRDGIISEARAAQSQSVITKNSSGSQDSLDVYLSPDKQIVTERDLKALDKNTFAIDDKLQIAVVRPNTASWSVGEVPTVERLSFLDQPIMGFSIATMRGSAGITEARGTVFAISSELPRTIILNGDSEISGVRLDANPFADRDFLKNSLTQQLKSAAMISDKISNDPASIDAQVELMMTMVGDTMKSGTQKYINSSIPITKHLRAGVYVSSFREADLFKVTGVLGSFANSLTVLDRALGQLAMSGLFMGGGRNVKVDQQRGIASFNGSTGLQHVVVDGKTRDVILNDIGFVVAGKERVLLVQLLCLDIEGLDTALQLKRIMDSLLFVVS